MRAAASACCIIVLFAGGVGLRLGVGDTNFDNAYGTSDISAFTNALNANNASFNPAADLNAGIRLSTRMTTR